MTYSRNRTIVLAITQGHMTRRQAATEFGLSTRQIGRLLDQYRTGGLTALVPQSKRPLTNPNQTPDHVIEKILELRTQLARDGLDAGAQSIWDHLLTAERPSPTTIWRILKREGSITPQPQKRPRSSWHRFQAAAPNGCWQSDITHIRLADGTDTEVISWLDDHSRYLLHISTHPRVTGDIVVNTFLTTADTHGLSAATLTDNGMIYTTRLSRGNSSRNTQLNRFEQLLSDLNIDQRNGKPNKPTTQGKIERFHQTLKNGSKPNQPPSN